MSRTPERRAHPDRRKAARGGRRPHDSDGFAPLVLVVGHGQDPRRESEAILSRLRFAVAPAVDLAEALRVIESVHPDLIVAQADDAAKLRDQAVVPVVEYAASDATGEDLVEQIRRAIRQRARHVS